MNVHFMDILYSNGLLNYLKNCTYWSNPPVLEKISARDLNDQ